jgi:hypothetical protein
MNLSKLVLYGAGTVIVAAVVGIFAAPKLSAAIKAAFVEVVIPSKPVYESMTVLNSPVSVGPDTGTWGVTNITLTNYDASPQQVFIFAPVFASGGGAGCSGAIIGGGSPQLQIYVQPQQTLVIPYPTPLVFPGVSGHTCIAAEVTTLLHGGSVSVDVNGFDN